MYDYLSYYNILVYVYSYFDDYEQLDECPWIWAKFVNLVCVSQSSTLFCKK